MTDQEKKMIQHYTDAELLSLYANLCEGVLEISDGAQYDKEELFTFTRNEILQRMKGGKA